MIQKMMPEMSFCPKSSSTFFLTVLIIITLSACEYRSAESNTSDIVLADQAMKERDLGDAEMYYEKYLRKNPDGKERLDVWHKLLQIALHMRHDKTTAREYLEIMLVEFEDNPTERRHVQAQLASLCNELRLYNRAVALWEYLAADEGTPAEDKADVYRALSHAYLRRLEFSMATEVLELCLQLKVKPSTKADCLYAKAETEVLTEDLDDAERALEDLLTIEEADQQRRVLAIFMLADVKEQKNELDEARELFESIRETYPNEKVIENRLNFLKTHTTKAKGRS